MSRRRKKSLSIKILINEVVLLNRCHSRYIVRVDLKELGIDETSFDELQELFKMFDNDKDGILSIKEFEKILSVLGRSGINLF